MHLVRLDHECLLHLFSFLDKDSRRSLSLTCLRLHQVFRDPRLWIALRFSSPRQLKADNFVLGASLRHLSIRWLSSRVLQVCNVEERLKTSFQRAVCGKHEGLVSTFLARVCRMSPNLLSLTLAGCGHVTDGDLLAVLRACGRLRFLRLENCVRVTDRLLDGLVDHGAALEAVKVDFCRNITRAGLRGVGEKRPGLRLSAERSADMIPDSEPEDKAVLERTFRKVLRVS